MYGITKVVVAGSSSVGLSYFSYSNWACCWTHELVCMCLQQVHQELLGQYFSDRFGVDYRSLRYPGVVSSHTLPGGGTTDYAIEIFYAALLSGEYTCFLSKDVALPMVYMPDCLQATYELMMAPRENLKQCTYNVTAMSFTPEELSASIQKLVPQFKMRYSPDFRELIAKTWPVSIDDSAARRDWNWSPKFDIDVSSSKLWRALITILWSTLLFLGLL